MEDPSMNVPDAAIHANLPAGSGLSSSAAPQVATAMASDLACLRRDQIEWESVAAQQTEPMKVSPATGVFSALEEANPISSSDRLFLNRRWAPRLRCRLGPYPVGASHNLGICFRGLTVTSMTLAPGKSPGLKLIPAHEAAPDILQ
jgi:hypothetical protein